MSRNIYFSNKTPHLTHEAIYYNDTPFKSGGGLKDSIVLNVKTAYDLAVENGFKGSVQDWLNSLQGITPHIGQNGNWFIGEQDTGISASGKSSFESISDEDINNYFNQKEENISFQNNENLLNSSDIDNLFN